MDVTIHHQMLENFANMLFDSAAETADAGRAQDLEASAAIIRNLVANTRARQDARVEERAALAKHFRRVHERVMTNFDEVQARLAKSLTEAQGGLTDGQLTQLLRSQADVKIYARFIVSNEDDTQMVADVADAVRQVRSQTRWGSQSTDSLTRAIGDYDRKAQFDFVEMWSEATSLTD